VLHGFPVADVVLQAGVRRRRLVRGQQPVPELGRTSPHPRHFRRDPVPAAEFSSGHLGRAVRRQEVGTQSEKPAGGQIGRIFAY
jgi:hypothetical protein